MEDFFGAGCALPLETTRSESKKKELRAERSPSTRGPSEPVVVDGAGANGSAERRWRTNNVFFIIYWCV